MILVTGGTGFLGSELIKQLTNSGLIQATNVELAAQQLRNSGNVLGDNLLLSADQLNNTDGIIAALASDSVLASSFAVQLNGSLL